jgi:hypothetical protein
VRLLDERVDEDAEQVRGVVDLVGVLADDPDERRLGFGLVELVEVRAECGDDAFVGGGVFAEDVLRGALDEGTNG